MKTNYAARCLVRIQVILIGAALAAIVGLDVQASKSLAAWIGRTTTVQTGSPQAPSLGVGDMMAAVW